MADTLRHGSIEPSHPGELLGEIVIPATGRSKAEIARLLGIVSEGTRHRADLARREGCAKRKRERKVIRLPRWSGCR